MSKPLEEYMLVNLDGLAFARSSPTLKLSNRRQSGIFGGVALFSTYCHCLAPVETSVVSHADVLVQGALYLLRFELETWTPN